MEWALALMLDTNSFMIYLLYSFSELHPRSFSKQQLASIRVYLLEVWSN